MKHKNYSSQTSFLDLLFNSLLAFVAFFALAILMIKKQDVETPSSVNKVEYMVSAVWPPDLNNDIDLYMADPLGNIVYFNRREDGLMHLDRDDVGTKNDEISLPDGSKFVYKENREIINIRGIVPGEYIVNIHVFSIRDKGKPTPVTVKLEKMNPYKTVMVKEIVLNETGEEKTVFRFIVDKNGNITSIKEEPQKNMVGKIKR